MVGLAALLHLGTELTSIPAPVPFSRRACSGAGGWPSPCPWWPPWGFQRSLPAPGPQPLVLWGSAWPAALGREGHFCLLSHSWQGAAQGSGNENDIKIKMDIVGNKSCTPRHHLGQVSTACPHSAASLPFHSSPSIPALPSLLFHLCPSIPSPPPLPFHPCPSLSRGSKRPSKARTQIKKLKHLDTEHSMKNSPFPALHR